jgi:hypothetical protein
LDRIQLERKGKQSGDNPHWIQQERKGKQFDERSEFIEKGKQLDDPSEFIEIQEASDKVFYAVS